MNLKETAMDKTQQRIKIAEACGYVFEELRVRTPYKTIFSRRHNNGDGTYTDTTCKYLPDYLNDLNAMYNAIESLSYQDQVEWVYNLGEVLGFRNRNDWTEISMIQTTAEQRAEAFLRTLNLWET
jgi:hypothetical protein